MVKKSKQKAQAMLEYILIVALTAFAFVLFEESFEKALREFFYYVGSIWGRKGP